tara:strand:+ start:65169 stop:66332 length:1164 start_codon:yes stop_codon:yes gene_type:complete
MIPFKTKSSSFSELSSTNITSDSVLEISWTAIQHNINYFKEKIAPATQLMLMLKADAYGVGVIQLAQLIEENKLADYISVAYPQEGIELRKAGITLPIMVLNPNLDSWQSLINYCLEPEIHHLIALKSFSSFLLEQGLEDSAYPIHLKFNTGMNRLGIDENEVPELVAILKNQKRLKVKSLLSHLSCSGVGTEDDFTKKQITTFESICATIETQQNQKVLKHILNTNGIERHSKFQMDMVRMGIGIYGASFYQPLRKKLKEAISLKTKICAIRKVEVGASIGYSRAGTVTKETWIATLSIGYADGMSRWMGNGNWEVEIDGKLYPTIGNICMDLCMIDLGEQNFPIEKEVIIFGGLKSIQDFANAQYTISYEVMTKIGKRVERKIIA